MHKPIVPKRIPWEPILAFAVTFSIGIAFLILIGVIPPYKQICEATRGQDHDCNSYNIAYWLFLEVLELLDGHSGLIAAIATGVIAWFTLTLRDAAVQQGDISQQSIELARDEFDATHRPWIAITSAKTDGPLEWDANGNARVSWKISLKNVGNSPALGVVILTKDFAILPTDAVVDRQAEHVLETRPKSGHENDYDALGYMLFPGQEFTRRLSATIKAAEIAEMVAVDALKRPTMTPTIIGFIEYYFTFGERAPHFTRFCYHINQVHPGGSAGAISTDREVPAPKSLRLITWITGWHAD